MLSQSCVSGFHRISDRVESRAPSTRDCLPPPHLGDTFGHPRTPNDHPQIIHVTVSPRPTNYQISIFNRVTASHPTFVTDSVIHAHKRPHIIRSSTHRKYQSTIQHSSKFKFLRGHHLPPIDYARPRRQQSPISTIHLALFADPFLIWR